MPAPVNTLLIDGSFEELSEELAQYCDDIKKKQGDEASSTRTEIAPLLEQGRQDDALKKLVTNSAALNAAPEKGSLAECSRLYMLTVWPSRVHSCLQPFGSPGSAFVRSRQVPCENM